MRYNTNKIRFERIDILKFKYSLDKGWIVGAVCASDIETQVVSHGLVKITDQFFLNTRTAYRILAIEEFKLGLDLSSLHFLNFKYG